MTAQVCDSLMIEDQEHRLHCEPLEMFWNIYRPKPAFAPLHTGCWRGYIASWKVEDSKLYLTGIDTKNENLKMDKIFPDSKGPVFADWVTGKLKIPQGELLEYVHLFYQSKFESDLFLLVDNGLILKDWEVKNH